MKKHEVIKLDTVLSELGNTVQQGLNQSEVKKRLESYGENKLKEEKKTSILNICSVLLRILQL